MNHSNDQSSLSPSRFGHYEIVNELGRGGMSVVYRALDTRFGRQVAIKVLPHEFLHDPTFRARFKREAQTIATIEASAIVPVYDLGEEAGQPFLVMRYMSGGSLLNRMMQGVFDPLEVARIISRLAPALDLAHRRGIIHRDIKPANILFDDCDDAYLSDFGIVKLAEQSTRLTIGSIIGTPAYMSPEQGRGEPGIDGRSDIYALGALLYHMLAGRIPYEADTPTGMIVRHITDPVPNILEARPDLPKSAQKILDRAMAKIRDQRYSTATELAEAVNRLAGLQMKPARTQTRKNREESYLPLIPLLKHRSLGRENTHDYRALVETYREEETILLMEPGDQTTLKLPVSDQGVSNLPGQSTAIVEPISAFTTPDEKRSKLSALKSLSLWEIAGGIVLLALLLGAIGLIWMRWHPSGQATGVPVETGPAAMLIQATLQVAREPCSPGLALTGTSFPSAMFGLASPRLYRQAVVDIGDIILPDRPNPRDVLDFGNQCLIRHGSPSVE
jgi:serine/threonine protein kinase